MKKALFFVIMMCVVVGCKQKAPVHSEGERNAIKYAKEHANVQPVIDGIDTMLCADMEILSDSLYDVMFDGFCKGRINQQQFRDYKEKAGTAIRDIYFSWLGNYHQKRDVRKNKDYDQYWRVVYSVDGIRILMDADGVTPVATEHEFRDRMNHLKFNNTQDGRYCDF
jgi:hypothetical protein